MNALLEMETEGLSQHTAEHITKKEVPENAQPEGTRLRRFWVEDSAEMQRFGDYKVGFPFSLRPASN